MRLRSMLAPSTWHWHYCWHTRQTEGLPKQTPTNGAGFNGLRQGVATAEGGNVVRLAITARRAGAGFLLQWTG